MGATETAEERATRAEAERDEALRQADEQSRDSDTWFERMLAAERDLKRAKAQVARVRALAESQPVVLNRDILAALDSDADEE